MRFLCIFAMPRTGSSHLNKLLKSCPEFNAKSELFHRHLEGRFAPKELVCIRNRAPGLTDENVSTWRRENPIHALEAIHEANPSRMVAFKIFPGHLPKPKIKAQFLSRNDMGFAILCRRPIECFISNTKAKLIKKFSALDTTSVRPALSVADFVVWATKMRYWYKWARRELEAHEIPYATIKFEDHIEGLSGAESLAKILPLLRPQGFPDIPVPPDTIEGERQDKEQNYQNRVANWDEFVAAARASSESKQLLKWSMTAS